MGLILDLTAEQIDYLDALMTRYSAAVRWSFKRLLEVKEVQQIRKAVQVKFSLNSRQANDAVFDAQSTISSQHELVKYHYGNAISRAEVTKECLKKAKSKHKIERLQKKLDKQLRKLAKWQRHLENKTFPAIVFGGKKLFRERCKGKITREEWREARSNRYLSRGDKTKGGNLNTRLYVVDGQIYLDIAAELMGNGRYRRITVPIYLAHKPSKKAGKINGRNYRQMVLDYLKKGNAYQVEILRENGRYHVHVTIEEEVSEIAYNPKGATGVDTNPDGLAVTQVDYLGQFLGSQWIGEGELNYARANRRRNLVGNIAKKVVQMAKDKGYSLVVENLKFKQDKSVTAKFNRMSHGFIWSTLLENIERQALREGVPIIKVKPAFTSIIGILKYQHQYGLSTHQSAAYVIARRGLGFDYERVPKILVDKFIKKKEGFTQLNNWKQWSSIKEATLKNLKRKEVKSLGFWAVHRKELLGVR